MFYGILAAIVAAIVGLDRWTKALTVANVPLHENLDSVLGIFHITHTENSGAIWGILKGQTWLFVVVMILFLAVLGVMIRKKWLTKKFEWVCLAFIAGGGIGNMIDRIAYGRVTDMIEFDFVSFPVFNVADCFITVGSAALLLYIIFFDREKKQEAPAEVIVQIERLEQDETPEEDEPPKQDDPPAQDAPPEEDEE